MPRGTSRLGLGGTLAVVGVVGLLAAGFGVLGGRPEATPVPTGGGAAATKAPTKTPFNGTPAVTPWIACADSPTPHEIALQVSGRPFPGILPELRAGIPRPHPSLDRIVVPADVITEIWVEGGACALAWAIEIEDASGTGHILELQQNGSGSPSFAAQNRFTLALAPHAGGDYSLVAELEFANTVTSTTWPISIPPLDIPVGVLHTASGAITAVEGCDVTLTLGNRWSNALNPCEDDVGEAPVESAVVRPGERLEFRLEGWGSPDAGLAVCGRLNGPSFIAVPVRGCLMEAASPAPFIFDAPLELGRWIVALSACGSQSASQGAGQNQICGTWYASIHVQP